MKTLYLCDGTHIDNADTVDEAINAALAGWHEGDRPEAYVIKDEEGLIAATIAPIGSDKCLVIWSHGQVDEYSEIHYFRNPDNGNLVTRFYYNRSATYTVLDI